MAYPVSTSIHLFHDPEFRVSINEHIERHIAAGFKFLDFSFLDWQADPRSPLIGDNWEAWIKSARKTADENGAVFNQAHAPTACQIYANDYEALLAICKRAIYSCEILGIPQLVFHSFAHPERLGRTGSWLDENRIFFSKLLDDARCHNVGICIENLWPIYKLTGGEPQWNTDILLSLVDSLDSEIVGVCWDTGHGNFTGNGRLFRGRDVPELLPHADQYANITKIGKRLRALHINDNNGHDDDHLMPYHGIIKWDEVIRALDDIGYNHSFTLEAHNAVAHLPESRKDEMARFMHDVTVGIVEKSRNGRHYDN